MPYGESALLEKAKQATAPVREMKGERSWAGSSWSQTGSLPARPVNPRGEPLHILGRSE